MNTPRFINIELESDLESDVEADLDSNTTIEDNYNVFIINTGQ